MNYHSLRLRELGIDSLNEHLVFMRRDCSVCISEGFEALNRIRVTFGEWTIVASLVIMDEPYQLEQEELGLSRDAVADLKASTGDVLTISHLGPLDSMSDVRTKVYGNRLDAAGFSRIVGDIVRHNLSNIQLSAFLTACAGNRLDTGEVISLTKAMIDVGFRIDWGRQDIYDKHCIGGLPGNRTTPIVVAIVAAAGLTIPKTSSRAITSPAGTADVMETVTSVSLSVAQMRRVVEQEGGCFVWGGSMQLSPADDILIRVERALDIDSEGQLIASVLSKKRAAGSTHVVMDIPVGPTAKVRSLQDAGHLAERMKLVGEACELHVEPIFTDGSGPVGRGIGPALEAHDVLAVLQGLPTAPADLMERAIVLAGKILEMGGKAGPGSGRDRAAGLLFAGEAWRKFRAICHAQGGFREPPVAPYRYVVEAVREGRVAAIDNRRIARAAKLAGAPEDPAAGAYMHTGLNDVVRKGEPLFEIHSESSGELEYALDYLWANEDIMSIEPL